MGFRIRKSKKILPGVKLNIGKKSVGVSFGGKVAGVSINSKTGVTSRVSAPGTGISYSQRASLGSSKKPSPKSELATMVPQWLKTAVDCAELVNTTVNPEVFFTRYDLMLEQLSKLAAVENKYPFKQGVPSETLKTLLEDREAETDTFIDRATESVLAKAAELKTEKGRKNSINRFFEKMDTYSEYLTENNKNHLTNLRNSATKQESI